MSAGLTSPVRKRLWLHGKSTELVASAAGALPCVGIRAMKTVAQLEAEWVTRGNIAKVRLALAAEKNADKRAGLEKLLAEQLALLAD